MMMDKVHKYIVTLAAALVIVWILTKGILFVYNLTAAVNILGARVTNIERAMVPAKPAQ